jgi:hypothetical protein
LVVVPLVSVGPTVTCAVVPEGVKRMIHLEVEA